MPVPPLPARPPFSLRARILSPLAAGGIRWEADGVLEVDPAGRIASVGAAAERPELANAALDLRPWVLLPGMVDLHAHLPQLPNAGLGAGLDLLAWLDRYIFPLEREWADPTVAEMSIRRGVLIGMEGARRGRVRMGRWRPHFLERISLS